MASVADFLTRRGFGHAVGGVEGALAAADYPRTDWLRTLEDMPDGTLSELLQAVGGGAPAPAAVSREPAARTLRLSPPPAQRSPPAERLSPAERSQRARAEREERWRRTGADASGRAAAEMAMSRVSALAHRLDEQEKQAQAEARARLALEATVSKQLDMIALQQHEIEGLRHRVRQLEATTGLEPPPVRSSSTAVDAAASLVLAARPSSPPVARREPPQPQPQPQPEPQPQSRPQPRPQPQSQARPQPQRLPAPKPAQVPRPSAPPRGGNRPASAPPPPPPAPPPEDTAPSVGSPATDNRRAALLRQIQQRRPGRPAPAAAGRAPDGAASPAVPKAAELQKRKGLLRATKTRATSSARPGARPPSDSELLAGRQGLRSTAAQMAATDDSLAGIWAEFEHHDKNRDGVLDAQELAALFLSFGYDDDAVSDEYISSVLQEFGDGVAVGFEQFQQLWEMLAAHEEAEPLHEDWGEDEAGGEGAGSRFLVTEEAGEEGVAVRHGPSVHAPPTPHWRLYAGGSATVLCVEGDWAQLSAPEYERHKEGGVDSGWVQFLNRRGRQGDESTPVQGDGASLRQRMGRRLRSPIRPRKGDPSAAKEASDARLATRPPLLQLADGEPEPRTLQEWLEPRDWSAIVLGRESVSRLQTGIEVYKYAGSSTKRKRVFLTLSRDLRTLGWGKARRSFEHSASVGHIFAQLFGPSGANFKRYSKLGIPKWHCFSFFVQESTYKRSLDFGAAVNERDAYYAYLAMEFVRNDLAFGVRPGPVLWKVASLRALGRAEGGGLAVSDVLAEALRNASASPAAASMAAMPGTVQVLTGRRATAREVFSRYDTDGNGVLDSEEVSAMLADIGYLVEKEYVDDVMAKFGEFDTDGNGLIDLAEFPELWRALEQTELAPEPEHSRSGTMSAAPAPPPPDAADPALWQSFQECVDVRAAEGGNGAMGPDGVRRLMFTRGYHDETVTDGYVTDVLDKFGRRTDAAAGPVLLFEDFVSLCAQLDAVDVG